MEDQKGKGEQLLGISDCQKHNLSLMDVCSEDKMKHLDVIPASCCGLSETRVLEILQADRLKY